MEKKANSPQMWSTLLWHVGTGLPWAWRTGPSNSSERGHLQEMLVELPENSLITADAGFVGYAFWKAILEAGHHFVIRVGGNVRLLKKLGCAREYDRVVYLWPDQAAKKRQPPLVFRLIVVHNGKHPVYLVTDLNKAQLSDRQAAMIYGARWGIELFFRTFKQTFGRRKLRSHSAENARLELDWSLLGLWCMSLLGQRELAESGQHPTRPSPAAAILGFQGTLRDYRVRPESPEESLWSKLRTAMLDDYGRGSSKTSRNYPRNKKRERIVAPRITKATKQQINAAKELKQKTLEFRFTAQGGTRVATPTAENRRCHPRLLRKIVGATRVQPPLNSPLGIPQTILYISVHWKSSLYPGQRLRVMLFRRRKTREVSSFLMQSA